MRRLLFCVSFLSVAGMFLVTANVRAGTIAVSIDSIANSSDTGGYSTAWGFVTSTPITVTDLGKFDINGGGLDGDAEVGIYSVATDSLIALITVPAASLPEANGVYNAHYVPIAPVVLPVGAYFVAASDPDNDGTGADGFAWDNTITTGPEITWLDGRAHPDEDVLPAAISSYSVVRTEPTSYYGGTFKYTVVPEPASAVLLGLAGLALILWRRRRA